ncbi:MAG: 30S ribosomal protein S20 [Oscillospiraceae bacterium]|nr:30S ribosomal protein S20 [Oscillospiraceae bacterium]
MPNIKSAMKRDALSKQQNAKNRADKSLMKTNIKKFDAAIAEGNRDAAVDAYKVAVKTVDHAATKHIIHKNNAANKKSQLTRKLNELA